MILLLLWFLSDISTIQTTYLLSYCIQDFGAFQNVAEFVDCFLLLISL